MPGSRLHLVCPEKLWMRHPQKCSKPGWIRLWPTWSSERCPCHGRGIRTRWSLRSFQPKPFYDSVVSVYWLLWNHKYFLPKTDSHWRLLRTPVHTSFKHELGLVNPSLSGFVTWANWPPKVMLRKMEILGTQVSQFCFLLEVLPESPRSNS